MNLVQVLHTNLQAMKDAVSKQSGQLGKASTCIEELRSRQREPANEGPQLAALQHQVAGLAAKVARIEQGSPPTLEPLSHAHGLQAAIAVLQSRMGSVSTQCFAPTASVTLGVWRILLYLYVDLTCAEWDLVAGCVRLCLPLSRFTWSDVRHVDFT